MYATATVGHKPLPDNFKAHVYCGNVSLHLGDLYLSCTPDEADRLANALLQTAAEARALRKQKEQEVAA